MKDRFSEWNLYHKSVAALVTAMGFGVLLRAILVIDTAFEVESERVIDASADAVWTLMATDTERDKWQAEMVDLVELTGPTNETGATRLLFWKRGLKRWQAVERTRGVLEGRVLEFEQSADRDTRWVTMTLEAVDVCKTRLSIVEIIEPAEYLDRFWFFSERTLHEERLNASFDAMQRWTKHLIAECTNGTTESR